MFEEEFERAVKTLSWTDGVFLHAFAVLLNEGTRELVLYCIDADDSTGPEDGRVFVLEVCFELWSVSYVETVLAYVVL